MEKEINTIELSAYELRKEMRTHTVAVFGAGRILDGTLSRYESYHLENYIDYIVDNNESLWNAERKVSGRNIPVFSPNHLCQVANDNTIIIIMVKAYESILEQLLSYEELSGIPIYTYPKVQFDDIDIHDEEYSSLPLTDTILLPGQGDNHENALAIYEYLKENGLLHRYPVAFMCDNPERFQDEENVTYIHRNEKICVDDVADEWKRRYYEYTSRYIFYENMFIYKKRPEQVAVYLKHGTFMLKNVKGVINIPEEVTCAICTSSSYADFAAFQESIDRDKLLICGSPRLDFLYKEKKVLETLGMPEDEKYILWLPTLRQNKYGRNDVGEVAPYGIPIIQSENDFEQLNNCLCSLGVRLIIKPHPHQDLSVYKVDGYSNIVFLPQSKLDMYDFTIHSLMRETSALISDYSSVAFDYMLLDRPIAYTVDDMDDYKIGFSVPNPFDYMPGEKLMCIQDMIDFVKSVNHNKDLFATERRKVRDYIHEYQDARNAERFLQKMGMI